MALYAVTTTTSAILDLNQYMNHLTGVAGNTEAYYFRVSTGNNFIVRLPEAAGTTKFQVLDSAAVEVWSVNSDGAVVQASNLTITGTYVQTNSGAVAMAIGPNGSTNPSFAVNTSATSATGIQLQGNAAGSDAGIAVISSAASERLVIDAKGSGTIRLGPNSTGAIEFSRNAVPTTSDGAALGTIALMWADLFLATGAVINFNNGNVTITHSAGGIAIAGANLGIGAAVNSAYGVVFGAAQSGTGPLGLYVNNALTSTGVSDPAAGLYINCGVTLSGSAATRATQLFVAGITATLNAQTLTNHNAAYFGTPVNGSTVRVIDSASGGYLTTSGVWTDNVSWASLKDHIRPVTEVDDWLEWMATSYKPVWYRYQTKQDKRGKITQKHQDYEYDHIGYLLDDLPESLRTAVMNDPEGGIAGKDERGVLLALVARLAAKVAALESRA